MVELMITVFIFSAVMILATSSLSLGFMSGRLHSTSSQEANRSMNLAFDIIGQKMANANERYNGTGANFYGFQVINDGSPVVETLVIVSKGDPDPICTYIGKRDKLLKMAQKTCGMSIDIDGNPRFTPILDNTISNEKLEVTEFKLVELLPDGVTKDDRYTYEFDPASPNIAPYITISLKIKDDKTGVEQSAKTAYNIPYLTYGQW